MRETGSPKVNLHFTAGTPEETAHNRENVKAAFRSALLRQGGNRKLNISWNEPVSDKSKNENL